MTRAARIGEIEYAAIEREITHVLVWQPQWLVRGGSAAWELVTIGEYNSGNFRGTWESAPLPENADLAALATWAGQQLGYPAGYPLALYRDTELIACPRALRFKMHSPVYYVVPGRRS